jgi:hypothetical protein
MSVKLFAAITTSSAMAGMGWYMLNSEDRHEIEQKTQRSISGKYKQVSSMFFLSCFSIMFQCKCIISHSFA